MFNPIAVTRFDLSKIKKGRRLRQYAGRVLVAVGFALLAACGETLNVGNPGYVQGFAGAAVADEPHAALAGRDVLSAGGTAGDAAATVFFALAVTKPAKAGLAANGLCTAFDPVQDLYRSYRFYSPAAVRAMAAIQARFGVLPWAASVGAAERLARLGHRVSRSFVTDWRANPPTDMGALAPLGKAPRVGDQLRQPALSVLMGQIRLNGAGAFYGGPAAQTIWQAASDAGLAIDRTAWRQAVPEAADSTKLALGDHQIAFPPFAGSPGPAAIAAWPALDDADDDATRDRIAATRQSADTTAAFETGFVVVDRFGGSVACILSMGGPFGGKGPAIAGLYLPQAAEVSSAPLMVGNSNTAILLGGFAAAGAPGVAALAALLTLDERTPAEAAIPRLQALVPTGRLSFIACPRGLPNYPESCTAVSAPGGNGLAAVAGRQ